MTMIKNMVFLFSLIFQIMRGGLTMNNQIYVDMYVALIIAKRRTIDQVPAHLQEAVLADLAAIGLDGNGDPLQA